MRLLSAAEFGASQPDVAQDVFASLDGAVNLVLPGSDLHERYQAAEEIGLATVIGADRKGSAYSLLDPDVVSRLAFMADNQAARPGAWEAKSSDAVTLGAEIPEGIGRFTAYAIAKINGIAVKQDVASHDVRGPSLGPGVVGIAGARWLDGAFIGVSGLWEVHDHVTAEIYMNELESVAEGRRPKSPDDLAADIASIFGRINYLHKDVRAEKLGRADVSMLLTMADIVVAKLRASPAPFGV